MYDVVIEYIITSPVITENLY